MVRSSSQSSTGVERPSSTPGAGGLRHAPPWLSLPRTEKCLPPKDHHREPSTLAPDCSSCLRDDRPRSSGTLLSHDIGPFRRSVEPILRWWQLWFGAAIEFEPLAENGFIPCPRRTGTCTTDVWMHLLRHPGPTPPLATDPPTRSCTGV